MNWKSVNKFAIIVVLMIAIPEITGQVLFDRPHPTDSAVSAAVQFANSLHDNSQKTGICHLGLQEDPSDSHIVRVAGLESEYGNFTCNQNT